MKNNPSGASSSGAAQPAGASLEALETAPPVDIRVSCSDPWSPSPVMQDAYFSSSDAQPVMLQRDYQERLPDHDLRRARDLAAAAAIGRQAARSEMPRSLARGDAFNAAIRAGRDALARGAANEEAIAAANEAGEALWQ